MPVPYSHVLADRDPITVIAETPARLAAALAHVTPEQAELRPAPGKWNLREVIAHLADCEIAWSWRLRQALAPPADEPTPLMQPFDHDAWSRPYAAYTLEAARATLFALRSWNLAFVSTLTPSDRQKPIIHPERGAETLNTLLEVMAGHDLHHLNTLEASTKPL